MTTNGDIPPGRPDDDGPFEYLTGDALDIVDETVARISDAEVNEQLIKVLIEAGYNVQMPDLWRECETEADLMAAARLKAKLLDRQVRCAQEAVEAAREEAGRIIADARDEADVALDQAASMVRDAREQAERIISEARNEATWIVEFSSQIAQSLPRQDPSVTASSGEVSGISATANSAPGGQSVRRWRGPAVKVADPASARWPNSLAVTLGGSFAGRTWEIKVGIGQAKARDADDLEFSSRVQASRSGFPDDGPGRFVHEPGCRYVHYGQAPPSIRRSSSQETRVLSGVRELPRAQASEKIEVVNFWDSLNSDQKRVFMVRAHKRVFAAGARLMQEGEQADHVAVILNGLTEIRVREDDVERVVAVRGPGQLIGERAALEVSARSATVVALHTVVALVMRTAEFAAFISTYPAVLKIVEEQIFTRLREGPARYKPEQRSGLAGDAAWTAPEQAGRRDGGIAPRSALLTGQNCTVVRTDVVAFGEDHRDDEARRIIRRAASDMTRLALGSAWDMCRWEDRGDGLLIIVSPDIPTAHVIDRLLTVLPNQLRRHNRIYSDPIQIQLRIAMEVGPIEEDEVGMNGKSIIQASRMLEAPAFKRVIADQGALLGLVVSPFVYETHIGRGDGSLDPAGYTQIPVQVKETCTTAWMQLVPPAALRLRRGSH